MNEKTIHTSHRRYDPFTRILNETIRDSRLSFKARGLLVFMLGMPKDWETRMGWIEEQTTEGREAIRSALAELESLGYLRREKKRSESGHHDGYVWHWFEEPETGDGKPSADGERETGTRLPSPTKEIPNKEKRDKETSADAGLDSDPEIFSPNEIQKAWNEECPSLPAVQHMTATRFKHAKARCGGSISRLRETFRRVEASNFITGRSSRGPSPWANFDWVMKPDNWAKINEGRYDNRSGDARNVAIDEQSPVGKNAF